MGLFDFFFKNKSMSLKEANDLNNQIIKDSPVSENKENELLKNASSLLTNGYFEDAVEAYQQMAEEFPEKKGLYQSQVGAAYYFLGDYKKAIEYYVSAMNNGFDRQMSEDNIWEASEELYKQQHELKVIVYYLDLFPNGRYAKNATQYLL
jgi:tetratricopeptide (TPR) repeat protein